MHRCARGCFNPGQADQSVTMRGVLGKKPTTGGSLGAGATCGTATKQVVGQTQSDTIIQLTLTFLRDLGLIGFPARVRDTDG